MQIKKHHQEQLFIGGVWRAPISERRISVLNPATGEQIASIPEAGPEDADLAVRLANEAFETGPWARMSPAERGVVLDRAVALLEERSDELVDLIIRDLGSARASATHVHNAAIGVWRYYAERARTVRFEEVQKAPTGAEVLLCKEPVGTVLAVVPWNGPVVLASLKLVPALLAGCSVVMKPAPETPLGPLVVADILAEAGVPEGVVSILPGGRELGESLTANPGIDMISFTGGTIAGKAVMAAASEHLSRITLELGGKSAAVVLDDIEPADAIPVLTGGMLNQSGQVCTSLTRILVSEARHDEWRDALVRLFESQVIGDPSDPATTFGPLSSAAHQQRVLEHIERAKADGGVIVTGGKVPADAEEGYFVEPTLVDGVTTDMRLAQEEVFGPVFALMTYRDVDDAVRIANDSDYGLSGAVMTNDIALGVEIGRRIRTGTFSVNGFGALLSHPFGGYKQSGIGREGGEAGLDSFLELKQIRVPVGVPMPGVS
jgi:betaine-aldehyde dehydrogenase